MSITFLELPLPHDRSRSSHPLLIALDDISAVEPTKYYESGMVLPRDGATIHTRAGGSFIVAKTVSEVRDLMARAVGQ